MVYKEQALKQSDMPVDPSTKKTYSLKQAEHLVGARLPRVRRDTGQEYAKLEASKICSANRSGMQRAGSSWQETSPNLANSQ